MLFGYGLTFLGHNVLHSFKNPFHYHGQTEEGHDHKQSVEKHDHHYQKQHQHGHEHPHAKPTEDSHHHPHDKPHAKNHQRPKTTHDIDDHSVALSNLKDHQQDVSTSEALHFLFTFTYWTSVEGQSFKPLQLNLTQHKYLYRALYQSRSSPPETPPPLVSHFI